MLGRLANWLSNRLEERDEEQLQGRFDALARLKKATMDVVALHEERMKENEATSSDNDYGNSTTKKHPALTQEDVEVQELGAALESCLMQGLRVLEGKETSWWTVVYSCSLIVDEPTLVQGIQTAALLAETDAGKASCWLKMVLNNHTIERSLVIVFSMTCEQVIRAHYEEWAMVRNPEALEVFLHLLADICDIYFCIEVNGRCFSPPTPEDAGSMCATDSRSATAENRTSLSTPLVGSNIQNDFTSPNVDKLASSFDLMGISMTDDEYMEVSSTLFPHRHKGIKPWQHVFGVSLGYLSSNPYHSRYALIDPVLAIPNIVQDCIDILSRNPDAPRLFRATVLNVHISHLREHVEVNGSVPANLDANVAGALLIDFLKNLTEPLLTYDRYDAFIAAGRIKDEEASIRNITCLVQELPLHSKVVLEKLMGLIYTLQTPQHSVHNGLDAIAASTVLAPVLAFKVEQSVLTRKSQPSIQDVRFAAIGAQVIERMIIHQDIIFREVRVQVSDALQRLDAKTEELNRMHQLAKMRPQMNFQSDRKLLCEITQLFSHSTENFDKADISSSGIDQKENTPVANVSQKVTQEWKDDALNNEPNILLKEVSVLDQDRVTQSDASVDDIMLRPVWWKHGFNRPHVLENFENGGVLLLRCLAYMVKNNEQSLERLFNRALPSSSSYDAGLVSSAICASLLNLLKLVPSRDQGSINVVSLSVEPFWELLKEEFYFCKLFSLVFDVFDQLWSSTHPDEVSFTRVFCDTEAKIDELLKRSPSTVDEMRNTWEEGWTEMCANGELMQTQDQEQRKDEACTSPTRMSKKASFSYSPDEYSTKLLNSSSILSVDHVAYLDHVLPITCQLCRWALLYSTELHGSSLHSLLMLAKTQSPTLLVIEDDKGNIFGGFASEEWHHAQQYYGNGEVFLFTFGEKSASNPAANFVKYPWSRRNSYFMLCSEESLIMGGGGSFGLYLDADLCTGTSGACETFSSRPLVKGQDFVCVRLELWGFTTGSKMPHSSGQRGKKSVLD